jgi:hypothetical protein
MMPRGRRQLTDKQERILVQCQLMGMTTADLVTISNRLKALDAERQFKARVDEVTHGFTWTSKNKREFTLTDRAGHVYDVRVVSDYSRSSWNQQCHNFATVVISKPGTRFKGRRVDSHALRDDWDVTEIAQACPDSNKFIYRMMRDIKQGRFQ